MSFKITITCIILSVLFIFLKKYYELKSLSWETADCKKIKSYLSDSKNNINDLLFRFNNMTLLQIAVKLDQPDCVKLLLDRKDIDVNKKNRDGWCALHYCSNKWKDEINNKNKEICKLLSSRPEIIINITNKDGDTPLILASKSGNISAVKLFLTTPIIDLNKINKKKETALYKAINNDNINIAKILIKNSSLNINLKILDNELILNFILKKMKKTSIDLSNLIELILENTEININDTNDKQETALYLSKKFGFNNITNLLINNGAESNIGLSIEPSQNPTEYPTEYPTEGPTEDPTNTSTESIIHNSIID
jgi:ankyrin repeat protein